MVCTQCLPSAETMANEKSWGRVWRGGATVATYLLSHNPDKSGGPDFWNEQKKLLERYGRVDFQWSCGNTRRIHPGDRVFLIRLGREPRGIFAAGWVTGRPREGKHWNPNAPAKTTLYVDVDWDSVLSIEGGDQPLAVKRLEALRPPWTWTVQRSGVQIPEELATKLERTWARHYRRQTGHSPGFRMVAAHDFGPVGVPGGYFEGAVLPVQVNRYERSVRARQDCIRLKGLDCAVCGFNFERAYGSIGRDFIEVHHCIPLAHLGKGYVLNPSRDLVPVCPNCHAMLHRKDPPYTVDYLRRVVSRRRGERKLSARRASRNRSRRR